MTETRAASPVMSTKAGDPGAFAGFDLSRVPSPCFVVDAAAVERNLQTIADVRDRAGVKILLALKAFSMWSLGDLVGRYLDGVATSGLYESRLARDHYHGEIATYCSGYKKSDMAEICAISDHVIFNTPFQHAAMKGELAAARARGETFEVGLRLNPMHSEGEVQKYDPAQPHSRLGFPADQLKAEHLEGVDGIHVHSLCEQDFPPLRRTWEALKPRIAPYLGQLKWLNFGGGHHITRADYQRDDLVDFLKRVREETGLEVILEPGEAIALDTGILVGEFVDVFTLPSCSTSSPVIFCAAMNADTSVSAIGSGAPLGSARTLRPALAIVPGKIVSMAGKLRYRSSCDQNSTAAPTWRSFATSCGAACVAGGGVPAPAAQLANASALSATPHAGIIALPSFLSA